MGNLLGGSMEADDLSEHWESLLRRYHDAVADFDPPPDARWSYLVSAPRAGPVCHIELPFQIGWTPHGHWMSFA